MKGIVRNINNNDLYEYLGEDKYKNLRTKQQGVVELGKAREVFKINVEATMIIGEFPNVAELINKLNLKIDK